MDDSKATQHFLLRAESRTLSLKQIFKSGEDANYEAFKQLRWENGEALCPKCGAPKAYEIKTRRKFKCKGCYHQFSVTSGTIFASRKMEFTDLMAAICLVVNASKGMSAVQLSRDLDVQYKTAWVLAHKIREAISAEVENHMLSGEVEMDGCHFDGVLRKPNVHEHKKDRKDGRKVKLERDRVVIAIRERGGRTRTFVRRTEKEGVEIAMQVVTPDAVLLTDEARHWSRLNRYFDHREVNHSKVYSDHGKHTNGVESYFSRLRRMVIGQHHGVSAKYLHQYAGHCAWLEDHRRRDNGTNARAIVANAMAHPVSRNWKGYWQRVTD